MDRLQQKNELLVKLGMLFGPLQRLVAMPADYDEQERAETIARYCYEYPILESEFLSFCENHPGHKYQIEQLRFKTAVQGVMVDLHNYRDLDTILPERLKAARSAIDAIPIPRDSVILEAGSPFTAYCKIRDLCETDATKELAVVDAYLDTSIFHRYLRHVIAVAPITVVTSDLRSGAGKKDQLRHTEFLDISRLFAQERDPSHYRLILQPYGVLHDRWMRFDGKRLVSLGGSSKDAGDRQYFTVANLDPTPHNFQAFQKHIDTGTEYYGPSMPAHK